MDDIDAARTALVLVQVICGATLIPYARRSHQNDGLRNPDQSLIPLAMAMLILLGVSLAPAASRDFFELRLPDWEVLVAIGVGYAGWALLLHLAWRLRLDRSGTS
jgi:hypothetical protein